MNLVSIVVPIYNVAPFLNRCIDSILAQTYKNIEVILVDDGSTDDSSSICDEYERKDKRVKVFHTNNYGLVRARKNGLVKSTGEFIQYVDGDDFIEVDLIETMLNEMRKSESDVVCAGHIVDVGKTQKKRLNNIAVGIYEINEIANKMFYYDDFFEFGISQYVWSKMFKREILLDIQNDVPDTITIGEDVAVTYNYLLKCRRVSVINYQGYHYVQRETSITNRIRDNEKIKCQQLISYLKSSLEKNDLNIDVDFSRQIQQYQKMLFLGRNIESLDNKTDTILQPFGGISKVGNVVIYGAGAIGKSVVNYISGFEGIKVLGWLDREYETLKEVGLNVENPECFDFKSEPIDSVIIAISNTKITESVKKYLIGFEIAEKKIKFLTKEFIKGVE